MSKLSEYIKLVPNGLKNIDKVIEALTNQVKMELGTLPKEEQEVIIGRRLICQTCPFNSKNAVLMGFYKTERTDEHCIHCGCPIITRTASLESNCGIEEYNKKHSENKLTLKWSKIKE